MANAEGGSMPSKLGYGEGCPLSSRLKGLGEHRELPQRGPGQSPGRKRILAYFQGYRTLFFVPIWQNLGGGTICISIPPLQILGGTCPPSWSMPMHSKISKYYAKLVYDFAVSGVDSVLADISMCAGAWSKHGSAYGETLHLEARRNWPHLALPAHRNQVIYSSSACCSNCKVLIRNCELLLSDNARVVREIVRMFVANVAFLWEHKYTF